MQHCLDSAQMSGEYDRHPGLIFEKVTAYKPTVEQKHSEHTCAHTEWEGEVLPLSAVEVQRIECQSLSELLSPEVV